MKNLFFSICAFAIVALLTIDANAQVRTPAASPFSKLTQMVGLTEVTIEYSRPSVKDRTVFAENGLQPYGEWWRVGANQATKITFSEDVKVGGKELKAGAYAILAKPAASDWTVNFYKYETGNWESYRDMEPTVSLMLKPTKLNDMVETFDIDVNNITNSDATIDLRWEKTKVSIPLSTMTEKQVMASIERTMAGPSGNDYYAAASYLLSEKKDLTKALEWVQKANSMGEPRFWMVRTEALILAELGKTKEAIAAAEKSKKLAQEAGNAQYVSMNEESIKEWSKKK